VPWPHLKYLTDQIVVWPPSVTYDEYGRLLRTAATEILARWEDTNEEVTGAGGEAIGLEAKITVAVAVSIGSIVWKGSIEDFNEAEEAGTTLELYEAKTLERIPDLKGRGVSRVLGLTRHRATLPAAEEA
jgi:DNA-binding transcriptional LysR family regulator